MDFHRHAAAIPVTDPSMNGRFQATGGKNLTSGASGPTPDIFSCEVATYA
jgi:hypothetical protein